MTEKSEEEKIHRTIQQNTNIHSCHKYLWLVLGRGQPTNGGSLACVGYVCQLTSYMYLSQDVGEFDGGVYTFLLIVDLVSILLVDC